MLLSILENPGEIFFRFAAHNGNIRDPTAQSAKAYSGARDRACSHHTRSHANRPCPQPGWLFHPGVGTELEDWETRQYDQHDGFTGRWSPVRAGQICGVHSVLGRNEHLCMRMIWRLDCCRQGRNYAPPPATLYTHPRAERKPYPVFGNRIHAVQDINGPIPIPLNPAFNG